MEYADVALAPSVDSCAAGCADGAARGRLWVVAGEANAGCHGFAALAARPKIGA